MGILACEPICSNRQVARYPEGKGCRSGTLRWEKAQLCVLDVSTRSDSLLTLQEDKTRRGHAYRRDYGCIDKTNIR
jgi:hypothetical protein